MRHARQDDSRNRIELDLVRRSARNKRADASLVLEHQLHHLAQLSLLPVVHIIDGYTERARVGHLVEIRSFARVVGRERIELPLLAGQPRDAAPFDVGIVADRQHLAR